MMNDRISTITWMMEYFFFIGLLFKEGDSGLPP